MGLAGAGAEVLGGMVEVIFQNITSPGKMPVGGRQTVRSALSRASMRVLPTTSPMTLNSPVRLAAVALRGFALKGLGVSLEQYRR